METFRFRGHAVRYRTCGTGSPMVLLHNGGGDHAIWHHQVAFFARHFRTHALDLLGFGASDRPDMPYGLPLYRDLLEAFVTHARCEGAILVGNCIGASTALEHTLHHPHRVRGLVLFNVCGGHAMLRGPLARMARLRPPAPLLPSFLRVLERLNGAPWVQARHMRFIHGSLPPPGDPAYVHFRELNRRPAQIRSRYRLNLGLSTFNKFAGPLQKPPGFPPVLVVWGGRNRVAPPEFGRTFCAHLRPDRSLFMEGAGHMPMYERPEETNRVMAAFLGEARLLDPASAVCPPATQPFDSGPTPCSRTGRYSP